MSLINKVLQDLEARRAAAEPQRPLYEDLRPVRYAPSRAARWRAWVLAGVAALAVVAGGGYYTFSLYKTGESQVASHKPPTEAQFETPPPSSAPEVSAAAGVSSAAVTQDEAPLSRGSGPAAASSPISPASKPDSAAAASGHKAGSPAQSRAPASAKPPSVVATARTKASSPPPARKPAAAQTAAGARKGEGPVETIPLEAESDSAPRSPQATRGADSEVHKKFHPLTPAEQAEGHYRSALTLLKQGQASKAEDELRTALAAHPGMAAARELLAGLLLQRGHGQEARALLEEGMKLGPEPSLARLLARLLVEQGEDQAALAVMEGARAAAGRDAQYLSFLAMLYQRAGRHAEAIAVYTEAVGLQPADGRSWLGLAISLEAQQQRDEAARAFERALASGGLDGRLREYAQQRLTALKK